MEYKNGYPLFETVGVASCYSSYRSLTAADNVKCSVDVRTDSAVVCSLYIIRTSGLRSTETEPEEAYLSNYEKCGRSSTTMSVFFSLSKQLTRPIMKGRNCSAVGVP